jgi:hypothetical protein
MTVGSGVAGKLAIAEETTYGTLAPAITTPTSGFPRGYEFVSESLRLEHGVLQDAMIGAGGYYPAGLRRKLYRRDAGGHLSLEVMPKGFALLFKHMLGSAVQANLGGSPTVAYKYTATPAPLKGLSLSIQKAVPESDMSALRPYTATGCKVTGWQLDAVLGRPLMLGLELDACDMKDPVNPAGAAGPALASPITYAEDAQVPYVLGYDAETTSASPMARADLTVDDSTTASETTTVAHLLALRLTADNALDLDSYQLKDTSLKNEPLESGYRTLTGQLIAEFRSADALYNAFYGDARCALVLSCQGRAINATTRESLSVTLPDVRFLGETPVVDDPGVVTVTAPFIACDKGDGSPVVTVEYVTGEGAV